MTTEEMKTLLRENSLRVTGARLDVLGLLVAAEKPLSYSSACEALCGANYAATTVYRNLVTLREAGIARVMPMDGVDLYEWVGDNHTGHAHPHFFCEDCGRVECLPDSVAASLEFHGPWADSLRSATLQFKGECPDCFHERCASRGAKA